MNNINSRDGGRFESKLFSIELASFGSRFPWFVEKDKVKGTPFLTNVLLFE